MRHSENLNSSDFYVLLCHLKRGSVKVKQGDFVSLGQQIAEVGNSGSSIQPHLHIQVMSNDRYFPLFANLLPFRFSSGKVKQGGSWTIKNIVGLKNRMHYSFEGKSASESNYC